MKGEPLNAGLATGSPVAECVNVGRDRPCVHEPRGLLGLHLGPQLSTNSRAGPASKRAPGQLRGEVKLGRDLQLVKRCFCRLFHTKGSIFAEVG